MDKDIIERVARAAHLALTEEELARYSKDLDDILDYFEVLDEAPDCEGIGVNPIEVADILREDEPHMDIDTDILLRDMKTYEGYVRGPRLS
ncbi:MAG: aspartyl/glutamyl-tRNA amidotransferase subunit C [Candidatus Methanomethylophilaceae archaeon]|nr:aspartyl/glutamyl-tRNA amidotransferase subunit C [Candidatus Methanomethylophilaceae archaeon]MDD3379349.1 aspartyl/glutamyl-tRNA amidotransferase subunit C [Candidatus Methanomethylophilaceae archaeon]MDY0224758.1 aspartyl/glutamyl-tRNA amidotransferase subunit C [Candidatus Methanomethylophilaceae archaeon]